MESNDRPDSGETRIPGRVLLGLSGGVDSAASPIRLKEAGHEVTAVTFLTWQENQEDEDRAERAMRTAALLGIPHLILDVRQDFLFDQVVAPFVRRGRTA